MAGVLAGATTVDVATIAMPLELGFGNVGDQVVFEGVGRFEIGATTMAALLGVDVVFDERGIERWFRPEAGGMLAVFGPPTILGCALPRGAVVASAFPPLQELLQLMFQLREPLAQLGVFRFEFCNPLVARVVHHPAILQRQLRAGKLA